MNKEHLKFMKDLEVSEKALDYLNTSSDNELEKVIESFYDVKFRSNSIFSENVLTDHGCFPNAVESLEDLFSSRKEFDSPIDKNIISALYRFTSNTYHRMGDNENSLKSAEKSREIEPENPKNHILLGSLFIENEKYPKAIEALKKANKLDPNNEKTYGLLSKAFIGNKQPKKGIEWVDKALSKGMESAELYSTLTRCYLETGNMYKAVIAVKGLLRHEDYDMESQGILIGELINSAMQKEMKESERGNFGQAFDEIGCLGYNIGSLELALFSFKKAVELLPDNKKIQLRLAITYIDNDHPDKALSYLDKIGINGVNEDNLDGNFIKATAYAKLKEYNQAYDIMFKVFQKDQKDDNKRYFFGFLHEQMGSNRNIELATRVYQEVAQPHLDESTEELARLEKK